MKHYQTVLRVDGRHDAERSGTLFSAPSDLTPHTAADVRVEVARYNVGAVSVGEVVSSGHDTLVTEPTGATLIVPRSGRIDSAAAGETTLTAQTGGALLFSPNRRHTRVEPETGGLFLGIPLIFLRPELHETAANLGMSGRARRRLDAFSMVLAAGDSRDARDLIALAQSLHEAIAAGSPALLQAAAHRSWSRRLSEKLITLLGVAGLADLPRAYPGRAADGHVRRAIDFMWAHYADIATIADVADACEVGTRTLEAAFRQVWGQAPHQMLTEIRLQSARRELTGDAPPDRVTEAAFGAGFGHLGRFAHAYRERFGESPFETLKRARR